MLLGSCGFNHHISHRGFTQHLLLAFAFCGQAFLIASCGQIPTASSPSPVPPNLSGTWHGQMVPTDCTSGFTGCLPFGFHIGSSAPIRLTLSAAPNSRLEGVFDYTGPLVPVAGTFTKNLTVWLEGFVRLPGDFTDTSLAVRQWSARYDPASETLEGVVSLVHIVYDGHTDRPVNNAEVTAQVIQLRRRP